MKEIYDWAPWFRNLARRIAEDGPESLIERAKRVQWREDEREAPLLMYGDENIDPFSFFYYLAGHNAWAKSRARVYPSIAEHFQAPDPQHLDRDEVFGFPTPNLVNVLFHDEGRGNPTLLWKLFRQAASGVDSVAATDFENALKIPKVALAKLTQVLFLVNPEEFLPFDKVILSLGIATLSKPVEIDWARYREELRSIRGAFPGCSPYEINLLAYLRQAKDEGRKITIHNQQCYQVSTNVHRSANSTRCGAKTSGPERPERKMGATVKRPATTMRRLDLREWQRSEPVTLTVAEREALRGHLPRLGIEPAPDSEHAWLLTPGETVGALEVGGLSVSIRPKLDIGRVLFLASYAMGRSRCGRRSASASRTRTRWSRGWRGCLRPARGARSRGAWSTGIERRRRRCTRSAGGFASRIRCAAGSAFRCRWRSGTTTSPKTCWRTGS